MYIINMQMDLYIRGLYSIIYIILILYLNIFEIYYLAPRILSGVAHF